jgi:hypothetical protein
VANLRSLEPGGLLGLAAAEIRAGELPAARETLDKVRKTEWPSRFDDELRNREAELQRMIQAASK